MNHRTLLTLLTALALGFTVGASGCGRPTDEDWARKDAYGLCRGAIDLYPERPAPPCQAMHMCANEAPLTAEQKQKLLKMIRATEDCPDP